MATGIHKILDLRGGQNSADPTLLIADNQCVSAVNVDFYNGAWGRKRSGYTPALGIIGGGTDHTYFVQGEAFIKTDGTTLVFGMASDGLFGRSDGATVTVREDTATGTAGTWAQLGNKLFMGYASDAARLHCYDAGLDKIRRVGIAAPAAGPTVANTGAGAYAATIRYYRVRFTVQSGGITTLRSEPSASVSFTPSGTGTAARVTKPATINEGETHWELEASANNSVWWRIATTVVGTTTVDDSTAPANYSTVTGVTPEVSGTFTLFPPCKWLVATDNRIFGAASFTSSDKQSRVWFSAVLGSSDIGDAERTPNTSALKYYLDFDEADNAGPITALGGTSNGQIYVFKARAIYKLVATGNDTEPYAKVIVSRTVGCVNANSLDSGVTEDGAPCLYFGADNGFYRVGEGGLTLISDPVRDRAGAGASTAVGVYYPYRYQMWWSLGGQSLTPASSSVCTMVLVYDVLKKAWSIFALNSGQASSGLSQINAATRITGSGAFSAIAVPMLLGATIFAGGAHGSPTGFAMESGACESRAYVLTKPYTYTSSPDTMFDVIEPWVLATGLTPNATLTVKIIKDLSYEVDPTGGHVVSSTVTLDNQVTTGFNQPCVKRAEGAYSGADVFVQYLVGDDTANSSLWVVDGLIVPYAAGAQR